MKKAFTLIELLVVMTIVTILAGAVAGVFRTSQIRTRDAKRKSNIKNMATALELLYSDYQLYPRESSGKIRACPYDNNNPNQGSTCEPGEEIGVVAGASGKKTTYMREIPGDPGDGKYYYRVKDDWTGFQLYAHLESQKDKDCMPDSQGVPNCLSPKLPEQLGDDDCGQGLVCNFGVASSNLSLID